MKRKNDLSFNLTEFKKKGGENAWLFNRAVLDGHVFYFLIIV
jgi:hypothetical protein